MSKPIPKNGPLWGLGLIIAVVLAVLLIATHRSKPSASTQNNTVSDTSIGLSFNISKDFQPIPRDVLTAMNPGFLYGFQATDSTSTQCIISQTKLNKPIKVSNGALHFLEQGAFDDIQKNHPGAKLIDWAVVQTASGPAALLETSYKDGSAKIRRAEVILPSDTALTFAYCQSPSGQNDRYRSDFSVLFDSLKVTK